MYILYILYIIFRELSIIFYVKFFIVGVNYYTRFMFFYAGYIKANLGFPARARTRVRVGARVWRVTFPSIAPVGVPC
nr:MAG TPA: hypothetical protein [Caudoviricetes sp.]